MKSADSLSVAAVSMAEALAGARETKAVEIGSGALARVAAVYRAQFGGRPAVVVADETTFRLAGRAVEAALRAAGQATLPPFIFPTAGLYGEMKFVEQLTAALALHDALPVAVGAGTINDLAKLAAHRLQRPYLSVATASSMDGYTAFGASITYLGAKQTFSCPAPVGVVADLDIIAAAPPEMTASGYADLLAKVTSGADWIVADALGIEPIDEQAWRIVQSNLPLALADPAGARRGQLEPIRRLTEGLLMGGFAMQTVRSSRAASGAEHQFSHLWDMQHHTHRGAAPSHGFKVGIGTLASTALYDFLLEQPLDRMAIDRIGAAWPSAAAAEAAARAAYAEPDIADKAVEETLAKYVDSAALLGRLEKLRRDWPQLRGALRAQLIPLPRLKAMLADAGAPFEPEQIGISRERLRASFRQAYHLRRRYTVLDLAVETGLLESALASIFGPGGTWV